MKKNFALGLLAGILIVSASFVFANSSIQALLNDNIKIVLNGDTQVLRDETTNEIQYPITYQDRTYLPLRTIANLLGIEVDYDSEKNEAILKTNNEIKEEQMGMKNDFELIKFMPKDENYMVSPFSLRMAMMLAANGAEGNTKTEILNSLNVKDLDEYNNFAKETIEKYRNNGSVELNVANSIWLNSSMAGKDIQFAKAYKDLVAEYFDGNAEVEDKTNISKKANSWISEKTKGKISKMLDESTDAQFLALLINTIYFKGEWAETFDEYFTSKQTFTDRNNKETEIDFMHQTRKHDYFEDENMQMVRLPYRGGSTAMYVVLHKNDKDVDIESAMKKMSYEKVELSLPKFKTEYSLSFKKILKELGIDEAFNASKANFKNKMFEGASDKDNMFIDDVLQKTFIEVDESGTEAAAATAVIVANATALPIEEEIKVFNADRPFEYFIMDEASNQVLFMGEYAYAK